MAAWLLLVALLMTGLLFGLEWLGSEQRQTLREIPVDMPANESGLRN
jgi:hypothetical protein